MAMSDAATVNRPMTSAEWSMLLLLSVLWGGSFFFNGVALRDLPVFTVVAGRVALAALILLAVCRATGVSLALGRRVWLALLVMGLLNNVLPFSLIVWGQTAIASGLASILNATTPLFTALVAHAFTPDEKLTPARVFGVVAGLVGVTAMIGGEALSGLGAGVAAQLACLAAALSYALAGVWGRRFRRMGVAPLATATGQVAASSLILVPLALVIDAPWTLPTPGPDSLAAVIGVAALSTALAYLLYFRILATAGATNLLLVTFLIPVTAILLGVLFLGETLAPRHLLGVATIGVGLAAVDGRLLRALRRWRLGGSS
jgi:drug/metabolite transporter (DMT)-like permease